MGKPSSYQLQALCKTFAAEYGMAIPYAPLRQALFAHFLVYLPDEHFNEMQNRYKAQARRGLSFRILRQGSIDDADIFTALVLTKSAWEYGDMEETVIHNRGCRSMLNMLVKNSPVKPMSNWLLVFRPYIINLLDFFERVAIAGGWTKGSRHNALLTSGTAFKQRINYFTELSRTSPYDSEIWRSGMIETVHDALDDLFQSLTLGILEVARKETINESGMEQKNVPRYVKRMLDDEEFQKALNIVKESASMGEPNAELANCQLALINIGTQVLQNTSILQGLRCPEVRSEAKSVLDYCWGHFPRKNAIRSDTIDYYEPLYISMAGLGISSGDALQCRSPSHI
jgi:hypothetical protein